jgi:hypothetical protein
MHHRFRGEDWVEHSGGIDGFAALVNLLPAHNIGLVALSNSSSALAVLPITLEALDRLLGYEKTDWSGRFLALINRQKEAMQKSQTGTAANVVANTHPSHPLAEFAGTYENPGYGPLQVMADGDRLSIVFNEMTLPLTHAHYDHAGACPALKARGISIAGSPFAGEVLRRGAVAAYGLDECADHTRFWREMPRCELDIELFDGQAFDLGGVTLHAIMTPGHSPDSVCYLLEQDGRRDLFSGDEVFYKGFISVLGVPLNDLKNYPDGLRKLAGLRVDGLFPGHLMWVLRGGQQFIDIANKAFAANQMPVNKPFS